MTETIERHALHVMDTTGDSKFMWSAGVEAEIDAARAQFDALKAKGYLAYTVDPEDGSKGEVINAFDPEAEAIIMSPQTVGG